MDVREQRWRLAATSPIAIALVVGGLWCWQQAPRMNVALLSANPQLVVLGLRSAAAAIIAAAQLMVILFVIDALYRRDAFSFVLKVLAAVVIVVGGVTAVALELAGR